MSLIQYAKSGNIKKFRQNLKEISKKENKSTFLLFNHFLLTFIKSGCGYSDYLNYELYKKTFKEINDYVTIKDQDKFHQEEMECKIDLEKGTLIGDAIDKDLNHFEVHPKSKVKFDGFQIPNWEKAKELVLNASNHIHMVGWDVAVTEEGATLIEENRRHGFDLIQVLSKKGRKDIMRYCLNIINKNEGTNYKI